LNIIKYLRYINRRSNELLLEKKILSNKSNLEESCIPSYCHTNLLAKYTAWSRLFYTINLFKKYKIKGENVLDFGSGSGELCLLLNRSFNYDFIESDEELVKYVLKFNYNAKRTSLDKLHNRFYSTVFCLDSLEHNLDYMQIINKLMHSLCDRGFLIISGPTENILYKLGRKIAGFSGSYHTTNIYNIERYLSSIATCVEKRKVPFGLPLFSISVWKDNNFQKKLLLSK